VYTCTREYMHQVANLSLQQFVLTQEGVLAALWSSVKRQSFAAEARDYLTVVLLLACSHGGVLPVWRRHRAQ
jgi:hypothetical protein